MGRSVASSCGLLLPCSLHVGCSKQMGEGRDACATAATMMAHGGSQETRAAIDFCLAASACLRVWAQRGNRRWLEAARLDSSVVETLFFQFLVRESAAKLRAGVAQRSVVRDAARHGAGRAKRRKGRAAGDLVPDVGAMRLCARGGRVV